MTGPLTIDRMIRQEIANGVLTESGSIAVTPQMRDMVIFHHYWSRPRFRYCNQSLLCVMMAGIQSEDGERGCIVVHDMDAKTVRPVTQSELTELPEIDLD